MRAFLADVLVVSGVLLASGACWWIHPPAGAMVLGIAMAAAGIGMARTGRKRQ